MVLGLVLSLEPLAIRILTDLNSGSDDVIKVTMHYHN
jgi:hypothetical protein